MSNSDKRNSIDDATLSAYIDGELPEDQQRQVDRWLSRSPAGRQKLEEFRRLSELVQELPWAELPAEFAGQVLQQAEREMLLPATSRQRPAAWRTARFITFSVVAPVAAAAALLFISLHLARPEPELRPDVAQIPPPPISADVPGVADDGRGDMRPKVAIASTEKPSDVERAAQTADSSEGISRLPAEHPVATRSAVLKSGAKSDEAIESQLALLVDGIRKANGLGQTPVVRIHVVDRHEGLKLVQLVLDQQHIPGDRENTFGDQKADSSPVPNVASTDASTTAKAVVGQEAIFVVVDVDELRGTLQSLLTQKDQRISCKLDDPIDFRRLDRHSQHRVEVALAALSELSVDKRSAEATDGDASKVSTGAGLAPTTPRPSAALAAVGPEPVKGRRKSVRQVRVTIAEPASHADSTEFDSSDQRPAEAKDAASLLKTESTDTRKPFMRMVLLVEPLVPAASPAKVPAEKSDPGDGPA